MKVLSIKQPHALLCMFGLKEYETRNWDTPYRGTLLIHASTSALTKDDWRAMKAWLEKGYISEGIMKLLGHEQPNQAAFAKASPFFGSILGTVELEAIYLGHKLAPRLTDQERSFGWFDRPDRRAWRFANPRLFVNSIPIAGDLKLWEYDGELPEYITVEDVEHERSARAESARL